MKLHPRLSRAAVELVTRFETFQPVAQPASAGGWTVGYGHTRSARQGAQVSRNDAEALLLYDLSTAAEEVDAALFAPVTQRQFEALTAFAFNIGPDNFRRSSALARMNAGAELEAADEIERWRHAELGAGAQVVDALVRRRAAEKAHFLGLPEGFSKSPSAVLRPLAVEGPHEAEPPPMEVGPAPSATLSAANTVQARLRALVPDLAPADGDAESPAPAPFRGEETASAEPAPAEPASLEAVASAPEPLDPEPAETVHPVEAGPVVEAAPLVPQAPPVLDAAPKGRAAVVAPPPRVTPERPAEPPSPPASAVPPPVAPSLSLKAGLSARTLYVALAALGACLFVTAAVLILGGKAGFGELALGVVGALLMTPGVYGLLGPPGPSRPAA